MKPSPGRAASDIRSTKALSQLLLAGLSLAVVLLLVGVALVLVGRGVSVPRESSLAGLPASVAALEPGGFFNLGLLILLATPAARVVALLVAFARRRMWVFTAVAFVVLAVLVGSGYLGLRL
ncbi:MAG: DUF1634 domain-containing protein [Thermoleophilia bacterium]|jgi:uncharacterized membrane protein